MALDDQPNQIGVEIVADPSNAEARIEKFVLTVANADRLMHGAGRGAAFGEEYARQTEKAQRAATDGGIAIERSYTRARQAAEDLAGATQAVKATTEELAQAAEAAQIPIRRAYEQGADAARKYVAETEKARESQGPNPEAVEAAQIPIRRAYEQSAEAARKYVSEAEKAAQVQSSLPPLTPLTPEEKRARRRGPEIDTTFAQFEAQLGKTPSSNLQPDSRTTLEERRVRAALTQTNDKAGELTTAFQRLSETRFGDAISAQVQRAEVRLAQARARAQELTQELDKPSKERTITDIQIKAEVAGRRVERLTRELKELGKEAARAERQTNNAGETGGNRNTPQGLATAVGFAGSELGIPGLGSLTSAVGAGGVAAGVGAGAVGVGGVLAAISAARDLQKAQLDLAVSARDTGRGHAEATANADVFRNSLIVNREEALKVAAAYGEVQLKSGEAFNTADAEKLATLAKARGLDAEKTAIALSGLARGSAEAFEQLAGARGDLVLDRYAKSIGTTTARLTDMERVQALTSAAIRQSGDYTDLASRRVETLDSKWQSLKNTLSDFGKDYGQAFYEGVVLNISAEESAKRRKDESGIEAEVGAENRRLLARQRDDNKRKAEEAERNRQQQLSRDLERQNVERERAARSLPEDYGAGLTSTQRQETELQRLRNRREALQREYEAFRQVQSQFSSDDAKKFDNEFRDQVQSLTDQVRGSLDQMVAEAEGKLLSLRKDIRDSTAEFSQLRLPTERDNPYVKLFSEAEYAAERARERFGVLGEEAVQAFTKAQAAARDAARFELQVKDSMSAVRLEHEAAELARPFTELTGEIKRTLSVFQAELTAAKGVPGLRINAEQVRLQNQYRFGFNGNPRSLAQAGFYIDDGGVQQNGDVVYRKQFENLMRLRARYGGVEGVGGEQIRNQLNTELGNLYQNLSPRAKGEVARNPRLTDTFARAYDEQANFQEQQIEREAARADAQRSAVRLAERQLAELNRLGTEPNADRDLLRRQYLDITGALPREELTGDLLRGRQSAALEEAKYTREREDRGRQAVEATAKFQEALIGKDGRSGAIGQLLQALRERQEKVLIEVLDRADAAKVTTLGGGYQ
jgi:hypothetical protein